MIVLDKMSAYILFNEGVFFTVMGSFLQTSLHGFSGAEVQGNSVIFSTLKQFYHPVQSSGFAVKYVASGIERYHLNDVTLPVAAGHYLLANHTSQGHVLIDANDWVDGICINLNPKLLAEVVASLQRPDTPFADDLLGQFFSTHLFLEKQYQADTTQLGQFLNALALNSGAQKIENWIPDMAFFYGVAERIVADQLPIFRQFNAIPSLKTSTKKDLYRRVERGRDFVENTFKQSIAVADIAQAACMSEYHFFRMFKCVYGLPPHQYLIQKRLENSYNMLVRGHHSVTEVAHESGFSDIHTFCKAFKKRYGLVPSNLLKDKIKGLS
jgi:AraC family transcriptional regulator